MTTRRAFLRASGAVGFAGASAGCLGFLTGSKPLTAASGTAIVPTTTLDRTGYTSAGIETVELATTVSVLGQDRRVVMRNRLAQYNRSIDLPSADRSFSALFTVLTTPAVEMLGQSLNPIGKLETNELAHLALDTVDGFDALRLERTERVEILGTETEVGLFLTEVTVADGVTMQARIHVAEAVRASDDFVIAVGAYPTNTPREAAAIRTMMSAITHEKN